VIGATWLNVGSYVKLVVTASPVVASRVIDVTFPALSYEKSVLRPSGSVTRVTRFDVASRVYVVVRSADSPYASVRVSSYALLLNV
jgi:hypothetical protein